MKYCVSFKDEAELLAYATKLATVIEPPCVIYLSGILGAGKTTFVRGFLVGLGFFGIVKSPTFTLVETYVVKNKLIHHFDIYRLYDPEELQWMGIRDYLDEAIVLIEWPERAMNNLPRPDLYWRLEMVSSGRDLILEEISTKGQEILNKLL